MNTTLLLVDLLIAGTLATIAIFMTLMGIGLDISIFVFILDHEVLAALVVLAVIYPLGIIVDGIADTLFSFIQEKYRKKYNLDPQHSVFSLLSQQKDIEFRIKYFDYNRMRTRVVRSFLLNTIFMQVGGIVYGVKQNWEWKWMVVWVLVWAIMFVIAYWSLSQIIDSWFKFLKISWKGSLND